MISLAEVVVDCPLKDIKKTFDYIVPSHLLNYIEVGSRVIVPFGNRTLQGYVVALTNEDKGLGKYKLKEVKSVFEYPPILDKKLVELAKWMSFNYSTSLFSCIQSMLPRGIKLDLTEKYKLKSPTLDCKFNKYLSKPRTLQEIIEELKISKDSISKFLNEGLLVKELNIKTNVQEKHQHEITLNIELDEIKVSANAIRQHELLELLSNQEWLNLSELPSGLRSAAKVFLQKGFVKLREKKIYREPDTINIEESIPKQLNVEQKLALENMVEGFNSNKEKVFLLKGITGSGKTEVYLQLVEHVVQNGRDAIILVPEIALTPMMVSRFKGRFREKVAVLHSGLTETQKFDQWLKIKEGKVKIVVGARSAVFAPFRNLGVIVIDEEHEGTYKQDVQPRYVTREVAKYRMKLEKAILVLGSATPSVESYFQAEKGHYSLLELKNRANQKQLPHVTVIDMKEELTQGNKSIFSRELHRSIETTLQKGEQIILFLNKRGFSATTLCRECGFTFKCPDCDVSLTSHHKGNFLICHYCNYSVNNPNCCPKCKSKYLRFNGLGTEKLKQEIEKAFPNAKVLRMDNDTMTTASSYNEVYQSFMDQKANVLIGTQMIAKGFDFPTVTLVGIILADLSLNFPDYKSAERTFQLITQVAGRAGRADLKGKVILQTYTPEHYSIVYSSAHNYERFYNEELSLRKSLNYPPFTKMAKIEVMAKQELEAKKAIEKIAGSLENKVMIGSGIQILGPVIPAIPKIRKLYRFIILIKFSEDTNLMNILNEFDFERYKNEHITNIKVDIEPGTLI